MAKVRDAAPSDADVICGYKARSVDLNFPGYRFDEPMFRRLLLRQVKMQPGMVKVVEVRGKPAGYVWFKVVQSAVGSFGRIEHIFVDEGFRNHGLGKRLMAAAEEALKARGVRKIKLTVTKGNPAAASLYKGLGYSTKRYVMEKDL